MMKLYAPLPWWRQMKSWHWAALVGFGTVAALLAVGAVWDLVSIFAAGRGAVIFAVVVLGVPIALAWRL